VSDTQTPKRKRRKRAKKLSPDAEKGRLRVHDPFELIRWLALSQPDPRKALAELVQNSLDAGARRIHITRLRENREPCLKIMDDGEGVIPELGRAEALRYIATHIGHSRKRSLSPRQRLELMTQGQYGIGLLGFWTLGEMLEIRTSVPGQTPYRLILYRDKPNFVLEPLPGQLALGERWTEVVVAGLRREAMAAVGARRASDFLASELRGQLLARDVELIVEDRMARGRSAKFVAVKPPRFLGERLEGIGPVEVSGHPPIRLEIYLVGDESEDTESRGISLYAAGTLVAERFDELAALELDRPPWTDSRLTGLIDFPDIQVAPGSRRGVVPNETAGLFAEALREVEPLLEKILESRERERAEKLDRSLIRDLQRAFRDFYRQRPRYTMLPVQTKQDHPGGPDTSEDEDRERAEEQDTSALVEKDSIYTKSPPPQDDLFPPGPLADVRIAPPQLRVECGGTRRARAQALDEAGRAIRPSSAVDVSFTWELWGRIGSLTEVTDTSNQILFTAANQPVEGILSVHATCDNGEASAVIPVEVIEKLPPGPSDEGIPEPELVDQPGARWRSRMHEGRWQVNAGHPDYKASSTRPALKLRYFAFLFAKEVVLRSSQDPRLDSPLEQVVEVAAFADRKITERPTRRRARKIKKKGNGR
jgi:hypothetical protein